jgi:hypothetical protein
MKPGDPVKVISGAFADRIGVVLGQKNAINPKGRSLRDIRPESDCYWVMLTLNDSPFAALLHRDEIAPVGDGAIQENHATRR